MYDRKWAYQERAEQIAEQEYGQDFYALSDDLQYKVYTQAMEDERDYQLTHADYLRKMEREHGKG